MKDMLIIGGHGFIGSHFCKRLNKEGMSYDIYDNHTPNGNPTKETIIKRKEGLPDSIEYNDIPKNEYKYLVHFGSLAGIRNRHNKQEFIKKNYDDLLSLIINCNKNYEKIIYISSSSVLGDVKTAYSISKKMAESLIISYFSNYLIVRPFTVYGEYGRPEMLITQCINNKKVKIYGDPTLIKRRFTYVEDLINCILDNLSTIGTINAIGKKSYSILDVLNIFKNEYEIFAQSKFDFKEQILDDSEIYLCQTRIEDIYAK